ncbi:MAG: DsbE family thiol:disulfide interchange protein [Thiobacillaceae bacterium]|jgi:cytochrome c biogenesis protein CcmG, thiol:disulfide interchange protein DsbE
MKAKFLIPLGIFIGLLVFLGIGLTKDPREIPSPLIDKPAPDFHLSQLDNAALQFSPTSMRGKVWLLNVWASWCSGCQEEHPYLVEMSRQNVVPIYGMDYKDQVTDAQQVLDRGGNPYTLVFSDPQGRTGIDYGVYGVPETFLIDKQGIIRYKQIGPMTPEAFESTILPLVRKLNG